MGTTVLPRVFDQVITTPCTSPYAIPDDPDDPDDISLVNLNKVDG
jgi:hypothetical protein